MQVVGRALISKPRALVEQNIRDAFASRTMGISWRWAR